jgi:organic hydroperoxide reductase OsmC/OhrA
VASIESSPHPLVFPLGNAEALGLIPPHSEQSEIAVRTYARALEGMQKEAIVAYGPTGKVWRMVCDEGPYLNGTDLAPFPLAFFTAGLVASYMSEILALLKERGIVYREIELVQDNRYTMEGSAVKGTMTGAALPVDLDLRIETDVDRAALHNILADAVAASPAGGLLREPLTSKFALRVNGEPTVVGRVAALESQPLAAPEGFDAAAPAAATDFPPDIIQKLKSADIVHGVEGGAGSSLAAEQKRMLHVRGICRVREDGIKEIRTQLFKPVGSVFRFLCDDSAHLGGEERAPSGLAYLSAGIAFCYMTQLGRYASIVKKDLSAYRITQDTHFSRPGASGGTGAAGMAEPVRTHVFIDTPEGAEFARTLADMAEQTCFLHAVCRSNVKAKLY